jgi:glycosyltransferase involved in cell wall biosynthesis
VVQDGPVGDILRTAIKDALASSPVEVNHVVIESNRGLASALHLGLEECKFDVVARMDADDISLPTRFEVQLPLIEEGFDLVGSGMFEFDHDGRIVGRRVPPVGDDIGRVARLRDPFNHPTVVYRRSAVLAAGGYRELPLMEDYWLFARMLQNGVRAANVAEPLLMYRVDAGAYVRRGGRQLFMSELALQRHLRSEGFVSSAQFIRNVVVRGAYRFIPTGVRRAVYGRWLVSERLTDKG